jgi:hypothetical protein
MNHSPAAALEDGARLESDMKRAIGLVLSAATLATAPVLAEPRLAPRVLQAGIDLKVGAAVATGPRERTQLVFPDGGSLTLGPLSELALDRLVYDAQSGAGDLIVSLRHGMLRFVGGSTSRTMPSVIATPSSTLTVRDGTAIVSVTPASTIALLVEGAEIKVVANGRTEIVSRPGWQATTLAGAAPGVPVPTPRGAIAAEIAELEALERGRSVAQAAANRPHWSYTEQ